MLVDDAGFHRGYMNQNPEHRSSMQGGRSLQGFSVHTLEPVNVILLGVKGVGWEGCGGEVFADVIGVKDLR